MCGHKRRRTDTYSTPQVSSSKLRVKGTDNLSLLLSFKEYPRNPYNPPSIVYVMRMFTRPNVSIHESFTIKNNIVTGKEEKDSLCTVFTDTLKLFWTPKRGVY